MIVVGRVIFDGQHDDIGRNEARDVVHVPVRIVADAAFAEPDRPADAEPLTEDLLIPLARQTGVADLHAAQQPFFGRHQEAAAVDLDTAALEHDSFSVVRAPRFQTRPADDAGDRPADVRVLFPVRVLSPAAEPPVDERQCPVGAEHAGGRAVAQPRAIERDEMEPHPIAPHVVRRKNLLRALAYDLRVAEDFDGLDAGQSPRDFSVDPRNRFELARPVGLEVRPRNPRGAMRFPFGRHPPAGRVDGGGHQAR